MAEIVKVEDKGSKAPDNPLLGYASNILSRESGYE